MGHHHCQKVPVGALVGAALLMVASIALAAAARSQQVEPSALEQVDAVSSVQLRFRDRPDGSVAILEEQTGREIHTVAPGAGGFVRGVLRGMFRVRKLESMGPNAVFRLWRRADGRLFLDDSESNRRVDLSSFGSTNERTFEDILEAALSARGQGR